MREVPGFAGYRVTSDGEILSKKTGRPMRPRAHWRTGHLRVRLYAAHLAPVGAVERGAVRVRRYADLYIHVLVCIAWHGPPPFDGALVLHWDDNPTNNRPENLRWGTVTENKEDELRNAAVNSLDDDGFDWSVGAWRDTGPLFAGVAS
ncbi:MAG: HNH endonuclease signature motif containing protein [Myxococcota bacterium]